MTIVSELKELNLKVERLLAILLSQVDRTKLCKHLQMTKTPEYAMTVTATGQQYLLMMCADCGKRMNVPVKKTG